MLRLVPLPIRACTEAGSELGDLMIAEIISVGTELLLGQIVDTNAAYLAEKLSGLGISLYRQTTVGDNLGRFSDALRQSLERADLVITTGGLGPTADDITAQGIANSVGDQLILNQECADHIKELFQRRGLKLLDSHFKQAQIPASASPLPNPVGSAPGIFLEKEGKVIIALPGVPAEMKAMFEQSVVPYLRDQTGDSGIIHSRVLRFAGIGESYVENSLRDLIQAQRNPTIAPLAKMGEVNLRITAQAPDLETARQMIEPIEAQVRERLGEFLFGTDEESLEQVIGEMLRSAGLTLAVAESCTGGLICHRITNVPGSSDYLLSGVVAYSNQAKIELLGVPEETISAHGAVSEETARAMAQGVIRMSGAQVGLSATGIAGPTGATPTKPVGLVYVAAAWDDQVQCQEHRFSGDRETIKERTAQAALTLLHQVLAEICREQAPAVSKVSHG